MGNAEIMLPLPKKALVWRKPLGRVPRMSVVGSHLSDPNVSAIVVLRHEFRPKPVHHPREVRHIGE